MKIAIILCLVAVAAATVPEPPAEDASPEPPAENAVLLNEEQLSELIEQLSAKATRIGAALNTFRTIGITQIQKLRDLILANQNCPSIAGIPAPEIPTASPPSEEEEVASVTVVLDAQAASNAVHRLKNVIATLEQKIARMQHVGRTQIEIFTRFTKATGSALCEESSEGDD